MRTVPLPGLWLIARTALQDPYPCRCALGSPGGCSPAWCPCAGRMDLDRVPPGCCGHRVRPHHVVEALQQSELQRLARNRRRAELEEKRNARRAD